MPLVAVETKIGLVHYPKIKQLWWGWGCASMHQFGVAPNSKEEVLPNEVDPSQNGHFPGPLVIVFDVKKTCTLPSEKSFFFSNSLQLRASCC